jgi:hypothetical protein
VLAGNNGKHKGAAMTSKDLRAAEKRGLIAPLSMTAVTDVGV